MKKKRVMNSAAVPRKPKKGGLLEYLDSLPEPKNVPKGNLWHIYCEEYGKRFGN